MTKPKKLIEVAMPIKEISAESVRDKSIRHGHISTLHLWWARRPLPVCRAVVFASLVPDPLDENCPKAFCDAVDILLGKDNNKTDPYKPYNDIPYTAIVDPMEDNSRNRLMMFIGKFSDKFIQDQKIGKTTGAKDQLSDFSLIKWDNKNNEEIIGKARKLIWVAHNGTSGESASELLKDFEIKYKAIKDAENELYNLTDRHLETDDCNLKTENLQLAIDAFLEKMPKVFDPFAGGGAIPLEAARLGCKSYGNDINPVAHIIQKGSLEFPQKYGKPITYSKAEFVRLYGEETLLEWCKENDKHIDSQNLIIEIPNRLSFDVEFYAKKILTATEKEIGHLYPADENGNKLIAYYWARVGTCSNPSCRAEIPLLKQFYLCNNDKKHIYISPQINEKEITFVVKDGKTKTEGWLNKSLLCPICHSATTTKELKRQSVSKEIKFQLISAIYQTNNGKEYKSINSDNIKVIKDEELNDLFEFIPNEKMSNSPDLISTRGWGVDKWSDLFTNRQLYTLVKIAKAIKEFGFYSTKDLSYINSIKTYLAIWFDRIAISNTNLGRWHVGKESLEHPFSKQVMPMMYDFPESNIFCNSTGSALNQLEWLTRFIESECNNKFVTELKNASSGDKSQFQDKYLNAVVTDPPYYDAIAYADLSDFFYVWLKRTLGDVYPLNFATPQTPKTEECTALKHHRNNNKDEAKQHFENKLTQIFDAIEHQTSDIVSIMFAHQSTEAWTTLCNSILGARMNITGSWPVDTEMANRSLGLAGAVLESSVTVAARPAQRIGIGSYRQVKKAIEKRVANEVESLYRLGFRGADLLTACFGQAVSEFGQYEKVEKADGSEVTVAELLEMARESAFNALLRGFEGDDFTKFYIGWLQLYGFVESEFDDAAKFTKVGLSINIQDLFKEHILIKNFNKQTLGTFVERIAANKNLGERADCNLIDQAHKAMHLYKGSNRGLLLEYILRFASNSDSAFWRVLTSIVELLPAGCDDHKQASGLLANKDSLIRESKAANKSKGEQSKLFE